MSTVVSGTPVTAAVLVVVAKNFQKEIRRYFVVLLIGLAGEGGDELVIHASNELGLAVGHGLAVVTVEAAKARFLSSCLMP